MHLDFGVMPVCAASCKHKAQADYSSVKETTAIHVMQNGCNM